MPKPVRRDKTAKTRLQLLLEKLAPPPEEWLTGNRLSTDGLQPLECKSFTSLVEAWSRAMHWVDDLNTALLVMLAVVASTERRGDQLWLRCIGRPGCGKTRLCDALCTNLDFCHPLGQQRGFHSGWKGDGDEDYSLLARANNKTLVTPEGDELLNSPAVGEILAQGRRVYDGTATSSYLNRKEDRTYSGLRMTWIIAGTSSLRVLNKSNLGDRFIDIVIEKNDRTVEQDILDRVAQSAINSLHSASNGEAESLMEDTMTKAYQMTGGMVGYLRSEAGSKLDNVHFPPIYAARCTQLGTFAGTLRARPDSNLEEEEPEVELPTRLTSQFTRLAGSAAVVLDKPSVDREVMGVVSKVAHDTCRGITLSIIKHIRDRGPSTIKSMQLRLKKSGVLIGRNLDFMREIELVQPNLTKSKRGITGAQSSQWKLTSFSKELLEGIGEEA